MAMVRSSQPRNGRYLCGRLTLVSATYIIGWVVIFFALFSIISSVVFVTTDAIKLAKEDYLGEDVKASYRWIIVNSSVQIVLAIATIVVTFVMLVGNYTRKPVLFWPYLVLMSIQVILWIVSSILLVVIAFIFIFKTHIKSLENESRVPYIVASFAMAFIYLLFSAFVVFFGIVLVNRCRQLLQLERTERQYGVGPAHAAAYQGPKTHHGTQTHQPIYRNVPIRQLGRTYDLDPVPSPSGYVV